MGRRGTRLDWPSRYPISVNQGEARRSWGLVDQGLGKLRTGCLVADWLAVGKLTTAVHEDVLCCR